VFLLQFPVGLLIVALLFQIPGPRDNPVWRLDNGNGSPTENAGENGGFPLPKQHEPTKSLANPNKLYYEINDQPPWYLTLFLGFQVGWNSKASVKLDKMVMLVFGLALLDYGGINRVGPVHIGPCPVHGRR